MYAWATYSTDRGIRFDRQRGKSEGVFANVTSVHPLHFAQNSPALSISFRKCEAVAAAMKLSMVAAALASDQGVPGDRRIYLRAAGEF